MSNQHSVSLFETLGKHAARLQDTAVKDLFAADPGRLELLAISGAGISCDFSKQRIDRDAVDALCEFAGGLGLREKIAGMMNGDTVNNTEQRAVLHSALRRAPAGHDNVPHAATINATLKQFLAFADAVRSGARRGSTGKAFTDIINIGIGGSHLGPEIVCDALRDVPGQHLRTHFLANVDGGEFSRIVSALDPETCLFVVASKSFTTAETLLNAESARAWLHTQLGAGASVGNHFVAVSAAPERATAFGIDPDCVFPMWDWVGGRYSLWSAIGVPIALAVGTAAFRDLLAGAAAMDEHFLDADLRENLPVMLALVAFWNSTLLGATSYAVVPYDDRLRRLPDYLQQLEMESNGKRVTAAGEPVATDTAPVTWGGLGTNAQHAFFQLLHQGTQAIPVDFILALRHPTSAPAHHDMLVANCLAQAEALMLGRAPAPDDDLGAHRAMPGNRPSTMILLEEITPASLGALIALYEHKTFVAGVLWGINSFDQWGVELGKVLAGSLLEEIDAGSASPAHDPSTAALLRRYLDARG